MRLILGNVYKAALATRPAAIPRTRAGKGARGAGVRYERQAAKSLPSCLHNPWYHYQDDAGPGFCSPDLVAQQGSWVVVLECKLSNIEEAEIQLEKLYFPVLRVAYGRPTRGIVLVRHLNRQVDRRRITTTLQEALARPPESMPILHWLGKGPL